MTVYYDGLSFAGSYFRAPRIGGNDIVSAKAYADGLSIVAPNTYGPLFSISPTTGHATGAIAITATGVLTAWTTSNPFTVTVGGGFASITNYARISDTSATFDLVLTSLGGSVEITDTDNDTTDTYSAAAVVPTKPLSVVITDLHDGTISVAFSPPADAGGAAITSYAATTSSGGFNNSSASSPIIISGVNKGISQHVNVVATNSAGAGATSDDSNSISPITVPGAPTSPVATASATLGQASVVFVAPADDGGGSLVYTVTSSPAGGTDSNAAGAGLTHTITGLLHARDYTFTVVATNSYGSSVASAASNSITTKGFRLNPSGASVVGVVSVTATGFQTTWGVGNPFVVSSGPGTIDNYANVSGTSATFDLDVSALSGVPIVIADSGTGGSGSTVSFSTRINDAASYFAPSGSGRGGKLGSRRSRDRR